MENCPRCNAKGPRMSRKRGLRDWMMSLVGKRPARCWRCNRRIYLPAKEVKAQDRDQAVIPQDVSA